MSHYSEAALAILVALFAKRFAWLYIVAYAAFIVALQTTEAATNDFLHSFFEVNSLDDIFHAVLTAVAAVGLLLVVAVEIMHHVASHKHASIHA